MKAIAVYPGQRNSMHLEEIPQPKVTDIPDGRGVLVKVLRVGVERVNGLENYVEMLSHLTQDKDAIKVYMQVAQEM